MVQYAEVKKFPELFKRYRLRAEFESFGAFGEALFEKGYSYESSIFSHWQKGSRTPNDRRLLLAIIEIFIERDAIKTLDQANELLESVGLGYLTDTEQANLHLDNSLDSPFQVPNEIAYFTGREIFIEKIQNEIMSKRVFLLHGPAGVGKTALAIKLGHILRERFPDGVLWYKVDSSNSMDILLSIANLFGEDISTIKDIHVRASIVRTLLAQKKVLLIFDNVKKYDDLSLFLPHTASCSVLFTSQDHYFPIPTQYVSLPINAFTKENVLTLFKNIFNREFVIQHKRIILKISDKLGNLPLAIHIVALYTKQNSMPLETYLEQLDEESLDLQDLQYEDKNLSRAITLSFQTLNVQAKAVFISLGVFEGKDFSIDAVSFINRLTNHSTEKQLNNLLALSLIEKSQTGRYRMHPLMKLFARKNMKDTLLYLRAAQYYEELLHVAQKKNSYKPLQQEVDNIIFIFKKCYDYGYWDEIIVLWNPIEKFLSDVNETKKLRQLAGTINTAPQINILQRIVTIYTILVLAYWIILFFSGLKIGFWNYMSSLVISFIPLVGGLVGIIGSRRWGLFSTSIGKARFFISVGLFCWGSGNIIWGYYNFFVSVEIPYPSLADAGYLSASIFWIIGIIYLSKATGAKFSLREKKSTFFLLFIPVLIFFFSCYLLFFVIKRPFTESFLKMFFDMAYPTVDIIILTLASIIFGLSVNFFGGKYKLSLFMILAGFAGMYIADFMFSYTTALNIYYNGSFTEILFGLALFLLTWGTLSFYLTPKKK